MLDHIVNIQSVMESYPMIPTMFALEKVFVLHLTCVQCVQVDIMDLGVKVQCVGG